MLHVPLADVPAEQRHAMMDVLIAVAAADGAVVVEEAACLEAIMGAAMLHPEARTTLRNHLLEPPAWSAPLASIASEHHTLLLHLATYVAAVDGAYDNEEVELLKQICVEANLDPSVLTTAFQWVEDGLKWAAGIGGQSS